MRTKAQIAKCLILLAALHAASLHPQSKEERKAGFKLSIRARHDHHTFEQNLIEVIVTMTNVSKRTIPISPCAAFGDLYSVLVVRDGVVLDESESSRKRRDNLERTEAFGGNCQGSDPMQRIPPGGSLEYPLRWKAEGDGVYQFTVERKAFPKGPESAVTIRSNTVTITMPEPEADKPR